MSAGKRQRVALALALAGSITAAAQQAPTAPVQGGKIRVELVGDSTMTERSGYGTGFCASFAAEVECIDHAKGGASTKTYREEGLWDSALAFKPQYMLIQLGHNDVTANPVLPRNTTLAEYEHNLRAFISEAQAAGVKVVLVTPLARRYFQADGSIHDDLDAHVAVVKKLAAELHLPLIDLHGESAALLAKTGPGAQAMWGVDKYENGHAGPDKTHLGPEGARVFGALVARDLARVEPALAAYIKPVAEANTWTRLPQKFVLVGDSTVAVQGGWGPGFCALVKPGVACEDVALNGRSTKSFIDEGAWAKALALHGDVYLIQFGHNDQKPDPKRHTDPQTTFAANLRRMIHDVRAQGGQVVLLSPLARRTFVHDKPSNRDLELYGFAARDVAFQEGAPFLDLLFLSESRLGQGTQADADAFDALSHSDAKAENADKAAPAVDRTHLNESGKRVFGEIVARALVAREPQLAPEFNLSQAAVQQAGQGRQP